MTSSIAERPRVEKESNATKASNAIAAHDMYAQEYARLVGLEMRLMDEKPLEKDAAIRRIMKTDNEATGNPHSASSAEKIVEGDPSYSAFLGQLREVVVRRNNARAQMETERMKARLAMELIATERAVTA